MSLVDSVEDGLPDVATVAISDPRNGERCCPPPSPYRKNIFKDPLEAGPGTTPLSEFCIRSEPVAMLGPTGQVVSSIPGKVAYRFVHQCDVDEYTVPRIIQDVKTDVIRNSDIPISTCFEWVCPSCEENPCFVFDYLVRIGEIAVTMKRTHKNHQEIRNKIYRHLSTQIHGHLGYGIYGALPDCLVSLVRDAFPNEDN